jgi:hypothetical protein
MPPLKSARAAAHSACDPQDVDPLGGQIESEATPPNPHLSSASANPTRAAAAAPNSENAPSRPSFDATGANEISDPFEVLVEKTIDDPGAPFVPAMLERLASLKKENLAAYELLRAQLRDVGCRVTMLDWATDEDSGNSGGTGPSQADILIGLAQAAVPFHTAEGNGFADLEIQWPPGDLANTQQGVPSMVGALLFRSNRKRAKFGNLAISAERDRCQGAF